ncbi:hypothetical protein B0T20DRAFT_118549 [Sordaria brevicollis]|uniref:Tyrosinase copper-binding domain-containing protein n=1 Tax=Sordaria brevicollis TaxID=83679 RepID=A0AAE0UEY7_SORBR|nr:hypothetical protein B0T20DRAFT_118549 [Sordaria brevicollis]
MEVAAIRRTGRVVGRTSSFDFTPSTSGLASTLLPLLLLINTFASLAAAQQTQTTPIPVVGVKTGVDTNTGQRPTRRNINDLYARGGPQWDLYILALSEMQAMDESDELSYFSVAGVHGLPHKVWNGVEQVDGAPDSGYCPHGETIFAPWHRPYVALFEQTLVSHAINIASRYPASFQSAYIDAARTLRVPFWDWASDSSLPYAVMNETIKVGNTPDSSLSALSPPNTNGTGGGSGAPSGAVGVTVRNPLYSYRFHEGSVMYRWGQDNMKLNPQTERCAVDNKAENNGTATKRWSEPWKAQGTMRELGSQLRDSVYDLFVRPDPEQWGAGGFEGPHNIVHNYAGCKEGSTMANVDWSAFDPIFMLHHTNTDRLVALWQAIYYKNATFTSASPSGGQLGTKAGTTLTADSPLKPFHAEFPANTSSGNQPPSDTGGYFHTSSSVADLRTFGYTYPELNTDWMMSDKETLAAHVRKAVNKLYGTSDDGSADGQGQGGSSKRDVQEESHLEDTLDGTETGTDGGMHIEENNKITFRRSRFQPRSLSPSTANKGTQDDTKTTDGKETEENNKITFRSSRSLSQSGHKRKKRQSYGQPPIKNYYYTAELSVERSEVPLPCTISLIVNGVVMGRMSLLGMPMQGIAKVSMPLARPLKDVAPTTENGNGGGGYGQQQGQARRSLRRRRMEMKATEEEKDKLKRRGLGRVDMTPKRIIPFLRGNMTVEIRANDQTLTDPSTVPSLHLEIQDWEYIPRQSDSEFPVFHNPRKWPIGVRGPGGHGGYGGGN